MSTIEDKLALANNNVSKVYDAGCCTADKKPYINTSNITNFCMFDKSDRIRSMLDLIDTSNGTDFSYFFQNATIVTAPVLDTSKGTNFFCMFSMCKKLITVPTLDLSNAETCSNLFEANSALTSIPALNTSKATKFANMFYNCSALKVIPSINISKATTATNIFYNCSALTTISFEGTIPVSISFSNSSKLTAESLQSIVDALKVKTSGTKPTLTLHTTAWTTLEATTPPSGSETWKDYITNVKGWLYA